MSKHAGYRYDEETATVTSYWHCNICQADFYEGSLGEPAHFKNCASSNSYESCVLVFGPRTVTDVVERTKGMSPDAPWMNLSENILKELGVL